MNDNKNYSDPTECISEYVRKNNRTLMIQYLYDFLYMDKIRPGKVHKLLAKLPFKTIITTNFDTLIERSFTMETNVNKIYDSDDFLLKRREDFKLVKLHGDFDLIRTIIITKEDYDNVANTSLYRNNIKGLIF
ncbi:MAG: SIR2 family protein [Candidatus Nitrosocosmicus sp.]|nr:SIR2 family protein [Candidatus Nitrosocosmicus sp.]